jgi:type I restriction enzyme M protein
MNQNGRAGIVLPHGVLFRGGSEGRIREQILKNDLVEAIVSLPPKLFYGTSIPVAVLILNKNKAEEKKGKVLIIDAERDFLEGKNQNTLRSQDISRIVKAFDGYSDIEKYARVVPLSEIEENDFALNIKQYIDSSDEKEVYDVKKIRAEIKVLKKELAYVDSKFEKYLDELNY